MFQKLVNEAKISCRFRVDGQLLINSGSGSKIDPTLMDMSFVRSQRKGVATVYIPGSSIKGVFRARYEQLMKSILGRDICDIFDRKASSSCTKDIELLILKERELERRSSEDSGLSTKVSGTERYSMSCPACRLFGNLQLGSRIQFSDAFPSEGCVPKLGQRHGVGINRITGAAQPGALFDIEVVEDGTFDFDIRLTNFSIYQLRLILWIIEDIDDGMVTFGMGGSRGNGHLRLYNREEMELQIKMFRCSDEECSSGSMSGYFPDDKGGPIAYQKGLFGSEAQIEGMSAILNALDMEEADTLLRSMQAENDGLKTSLKRESL